MKLRWYRWTIVIVGRESGNRTQLTFLQYRRHAKALAFCIRMNDAYDSDGGSSIYYEVEKL